MNAENRRYQAGGNPAAGPHPDIANPTPSPRAGEEFPDEPHEQPAEHPQDQPDLDAFAARMGTDRLGDRSSGQRSGDDGRRDWRSSAARALGGVASGARTVGDRLKGVSERLGPGEADSELDLPALRECVEKVRTAMLTSIDERGTLSSRPLTVQRVSASGDVYFVVGRDADWVSPSIDAANVAFVDGPSTWISVAGRAELVDDRDLLDDLWDPVLDSYFPDGRAGAVVVRVASDRWEYWTAPNRLRQLVEVARAQVGGDRPDLGDSGTVET
jgi:general stress protein 26